MVGKIWLCWLLQYEQSANGQKQTDESISGQLVLRSIRRAGQIRRPVYVQSELPPRPPSRRISFLLPTKKISRAAAPALSFISHERHLSGFIVFQNTTHFACISPASAWKQRIHNNQHLGCHRRVNFKFISSHAIFLSTLSSFVLGCWSRNSFTCFDFKGCFVVIDKISVYRFQTGDISGAEWVT
jgi:hypothetical protein